MGKEFDIEDEKFELLLQEKRHRELAGTLKSIAVQLSSKDDKAMVEAINGQSDKIGELVKAIKHTVPAKIVEKPDNNIGLSRIEFVSSVQKICDDIVASNNKVIDAIENRLLPDSFNLVRNYGGVTESVKVNYKQANKITIKN